MFNHLINRRTSLSKFTSPMPILATAFSLLFAAQAIAFEIDVDATISDSDSTLMGVNHIALSVRDLDASLAFYQSATGFEVVRREVVRSSSAADKLFGREGVEYEVAVLEAPTMLLELTEFSHNRNIPISNMPMTCFR